MFLKGKIRSLRSQFLLLAVCAVLGSFFLPAAAYAAALSTTNESTGIGTTCTGSYIGSLSSLDTSQLPSNYNTPSAYCIQTTTTTTTTCSGTLPSTTITYGLYSGGAITLSPVVVNNSCSSGPGGGSGGGGGGGPQALEKPFPSDLAAVYEAFSPSGPIALSTGNIITSSTNTITYLVPTTSSLTPPTKSVTFVDSLPPYTTVWNSTILEGFTLSPGVSGLQITYGVSVLNAATQSPITEGSTIPLGTSLILKFVPFASDAMSWNTNYLGGDILTGYGSTKAYVNTIQAGGWNAGAASAASCVPAQQVVHETIVPLCFGGPLGNVSCGQEGDTYTDIYATFAVQPPVQSLTNLSGFSCGALVNGQETCTVTAPGTLTPTFSFAQTTAQFYGASSSTPSTNSNQVSNSGQCSSAAFTGSADAISWYGTNDPSPSYASTWTTLGTPIPVNAENISFSITVPGPDLTAGSVSPTSATAGVAATFSAPINNVGAVGTGSGFTDLFQTATDSSGDGSTDIGTYANSALGSGGSNTASLSYTFPSGGITSYMRVCADKNSANDSGVIAETNETNNCGPWTAIAVGPLAPTASLSVNPGSIQVGNSATLSWSSTNAFSCTGTNFSTGGATNGSVSVSPSTGTTYTVTCSNSVSATANSNVTVSVTYPDLTAGATSFSLKNPTTNSVVSLSASVSNIGAATASNFPNMFQVASDSGFTNTVALVNASTIGILSSNSSAPVSTSYTFPAAGTYYVRACANFNNTWGGSIPESNNTNNCGVGNSVTVAQGTPPPLPDLTAGASVISPSPADVNQSVSFSANASNIGTATASNFPNMFQIATDSGFVNTVAIVNATTIGSLGINASAPISGSYTFSSSGTYYVRACANFNNTWGGSISESNTNNNCGGAQSVTILNPTVLLSATPATPILLNSSVTLTWSSQNAASCSGNNFSTPGNPPNGSTVVTPAVTTTYTITCGGGGTPGTSSALVTVIPADLVLTANPTTVRKGNSTTLNWLVSGEASGCSLSGSGLQNGSISVGLSGSQGVTVNNNSVYTLSCVAGSVPVTQSVNVGLTPNYIEF